MGVITYSPLAGGWLSGKYRKGQQASQPLALQDPQGFDDRREVLAVVIGVVLLLVLCAGTGLLVVNNTNNHTDYSTWVAGYARDQ